MRAFSQPSAIYYIYSFTVMRHQFPYTTTVARQENQSDAEISHCLQILCGAGKPTHHVPIPCRSIQCSMCVWPEVVHQL